MKLLVVKGTIVYKGKNIVAGESFECNKDIAQGLLRANVAEEVVEEVVEAPKKGSKAK